MKLVGLAYWLLTLKHHFTHRNGNASPIFTALWPLKMPVVNGLHKRKYKNFSILVISAQCNF